jgi:hypothetical protein
MEDDFWNRRMEENKDHGPLGPMPGINTHHCVIEYKNGIQYVYACKCNQCLPPMITLKPKPTNIPSIQHAWNDPYFNKLTEVTSKAGKLLNQS